MVLPRIADLAERPATRLSGGEKARVLLARALAGAPEILLADEPVAGLDPYHRLEVMEHLAGLAETGTGVVVVLHDLALAARFCRRLVLLDKGRVVDKTVASLVRLGYMIGQGIADMSMLGVPQTRRRHVLVASLERAPNVEEMLARHHREPRSLGWAIGDLQRTKSDREFDQAGKPNKNNRKRIEHLFREDVYDLPDRLRPDCHRLKEHSYKSVYGRMYWDRPAQTITSGFTCMGQGRYVHPKQHRTLTPHEAARLQFIPDFFRFGDDLQRTALANLIGNAVPAKLTYALTVELLR